MPVKSGLYEFKRKVHRYKKHVFNVKYTKRDTILHLKWQKYVKIDIARKNRVKYKFIWYLRCQLYDFKVGNETLILTKEHTL